MTEAAPVRLAAISSAAGKYHHKTNGAVKECSQPASIKIPGRWFWERHALYGFPSGWTNVE